jgi:predicted O-linked N-acetylglucosamine transferase (SPINDLY family)
MPVASLLKHALNDQQSGNLLSAEKQYRTICKRYPNHPDAHNLLGCLLMEQKKYHEARHFIQNAIALNPGVYFFHYHLGILYAYQEQWQQSKDALSNALTLNPSHVDSLNNLGIACKKLKQYDAAIITLKKALQLDGKKSNIHGNTGGVYYEIGDYAKAGMHYMMALKYSPESSLYHRKMASVYTKLNNFKKAETHLLQALKYDPDDVDAMNSYAVNLKNQGKIQHAYQFLNIAIQQKPDFWDAHSNILFLLHFMQNKSPEDIFKAHKDYGNHLISQFDKPTTSYHQKEHSKIRIGYVSPDFKSHSVAYFIQSILCNHDPDIFEVFCYANVMQPDEITAFFQSLNVRWRDIYDIKDKDVIAQIKTDHIDILIDLAGHSANNCMTIFAQKPAPVQITYLGYPDTSGLPSMDYRITDRFSDPEEYAHLYTEKLLYMNPCFLCYSPQQTAPISKRSFEKPDNIMFGSFNTLAKINDEVIRVWSQILNQLPHSQLLLKSQSFADLEICEDIARAFNAFGISSKQLIFKEFFNNPKEHLDLYQRIDIALDTFPYNGTTTTFEALWMGIPVIGLIGTSHVSRVTYSILSSLGLSDLVGHTETDYISRAIHLANDYSLLRYLNENLRTMMQKSILTNGSAFTRKFEHLIIQVFNKEKVSQEFKIG